MREELQVTPASKEKFDVIIVGAGPAGATCARYLDSSLRVLLLDKRNFTETDLDPHNKTCGGLLSPAAQEVLIAQGLSLPNSVLTDPQVFAVRTVDLQTRRERTYHKFYYNMSRARFDAWLLSLVSQHVCKRLGATVVGISGQEVTYRLSNQLHCASAPIIIDASGAQAILRRRLREPLPRTYISIQEWYTGETNTSYHTAIFDSTLTDFYAWTIPKEEGVLLGATFKIRPEAEEGDKAGAQASFDRLKEKMRTFGFIFAAENCILREGALLFRPRNLTEICLSKDGVLFIGEAAGLISPSSAEGFSYALRSGEGLARVINQHGSQSAFATLARSYRQDCRKLRSSIFKKYIKSPFMFNPTLRDLALRSGLTGVDHKIEKRP